MTHLPPDPPVFSQTSSPIRTSSLFIFRRALAVIISVLAVLLSAVPLTTLAQTPGSVDSGFVPFHWGDVRNRQILTSPSGALVYGDAPDDADVSFSRLSSNGTANRNFTAGYQPILVQPDGTIIARAYFPFSGSGGFNVIRLSSDGVRELTFSGAGEGSGSPDDQPVCGVILPDGKILVGNGHRLVQLNTDGTSATFFESNAYFPAGFGGQIHCVARQADGKILVGVEGHQLFKPDRIYALMRLNTNGTVDGTFGSGGSVFPNNSVEDLIVQPDGRILVAGQFTTIIPFLQRRGLARLESTGAVDYSFSPAISGPRTILAWESDAERLYPLHFDYARALIDPAGHAVSEYYEPDPYVLRMALQTDGKIVIFGMFSSVLFQARNNMARLNSDGTPDSFAANVDYAAGADYYEGYDQYRCAFIIDSWYQLDHMKRWDDGPYYKWFNAGLAIQADGKVLIGGEFGKVNSTSRPGLARLSNDAATDSLDLTSATSVIWTRGGAAPEVVGVTFDHSVDGGSTWVRLGNANRVGMTSNWDFTHPNVGVGVLRARGQTTRGGLVERVTLPPTITSFSPASGGVGTSVTIDGTNFTTATAVSFNGIEASYTVTSPIRITATVPLWATTGLLKVVNPDGTATSANNFTVVYPAPTISTFSPAGGQPYATVSITGTNFESTTAVTFNGTSALFVIEGPTTISALVPAGTTTGKVSVTTLGGTATSAGNFTINNTASGFWSTTAWTGDSSSGIPATDTTAGGRLKMALHFGSNTVATVNGRNVIGSLGGASGSLDIPSGNVAQDSTNNLTAQGGPGSAVIASSFQYGNDPLVVNLHSLNVGQDYRVSFLSVGYEASGRLVDFISGSNHLVVDQDQFGLGNGIRVDYHFTATGADQTIALDAVGTSTWHLHGISLVEVTPQAPTVTNLAATSVTATSAVLNGRVNANGSNTAARFYYGKGNWGDYSKAATPLSVTGWADTAVSATVTGLKGHTSYQFSLLGTSALGSQYGGGSIFFSTPNSVPVASNGSFTMAEDADGTFIPLTASDPDGDPLTPVLVSSPTHGTVSLVGSTYIYAFYTPAADYNGTDAFSYKVADGFGGTSTVKTIGITVTAVNDPPTITPIPDPAAIDEESGLQTVSLMGISRGAANETSGTITITAESSDTTLIPNPTVVYTSPNATGTLTYTPKPNAYGTAAITVTVSDGTATTSNTFYATVNPVNDAPSFALPATQSPAGVTWTARDSSRSWKSIASSADGTKLAATFSSGPSGGIYTSSDSGVTWILRTTTSRSYGSITSSADGTKLACVVSGGRIYTSADSGVTWTSRDSTRNWASITSSVDGVKLAATESGGNIYTSTDSGVTWTARDSSRSWTSITSSADGVKLAATVSTGQIYTSTNSGVTWTARDSSRSWTSITSSADGVKLAATVSTGLIYTSTDSGVTWTSRSSSRNWSAITSSADGVRLAATVSSGQIYTSTDSGVTWTARESSRAWTGITSSADGLKLAAVGNSGQIYTSSGTPYALTAAANAGATSITGFATSISPGDANEASQTVGFILTSSNNALFSTQPAIAPDGTLTFRPNGSTLGTATVTVTALDFGGTANGGVDTSAAQTFTITINGSAPGVITPTSADIATTTATLGGNVTSDGGAPISERGVVYALTSVNANPLIGGSGVTKVTTTGTTGIFTAPVTALVAGTGYSFKAYATSTTGTTYTSVASFSTYATPASFANGSFETNGGDGSTNVAGWRFAGGTTDGATNARGATDGTNCVLFNWGSSASGGTLAQTFVTVAGQPYTVRFDFGALTAFYETSGPQASRSQLQVEVRDGYSASSGAQTINAGSGAINTTTGGSIVSNGTALQVQDNTGYPSAVYAAAPNGEFSAVLFTFTAQSAVSTIVFTDQSAGGIDHQDLALDNVRVMAGVAPTVTSATSTGVTNNLATLGGNVTSDGGATISERGVVYALTSGNANPLIGGSGVTKVTTTGTTGIFTVNATGLSALTSYSFKAYATNALGTSYSNVTTFSTVALPIATTGVASGITTTGATLGGTMNPSGANTVVTFQYGTTISYGQTATAAQSPLTGFTSTAVSEAVTGLLPHTLYHFRVSGTNAAGTANGVDATFTTQNSIPQALAQDGFGTDEDTTQAITLAGTDADGDALSFAVATPPAHGSVSISGTTATYTPAADYNGSDSFTFTASDAFGGSSTAATVNLTVNPVNDVPSFVTGANQSLPALTSTPQSIPGWATAMNDGDGDVVQAIAFNVSVDNAAIFSVPPSISNAGALTYTPNGTSGTAAVSVSLTDDATAGGPALTSIVQTFTITVAAPPEIAVTGNNVNIVDGDAVPSLADFTDFGSAGTTAGTVVRTFTVNNGGLGALTLGTVTVGGTNAADFSVTAQPASSLAPAGSTTFQITFDPSAAGLRTATLSFTTNDADENPFNFSIQGTGYTSAVDAATAKYAESFGLSGAAAAPAAIPFKDGVSNLLKYAFNMSAAGPNVSQLTPETGTSGLPAITFPSSNGTPASVSVEFVRRRNSGLIYTPLYSTGDLNSFVPMTAAPVVTVIDANWERVVVDQPLPTPRPARVFSRVSVSTP